MNQDVNVWLQYVQDNSSGLTPVQKLLIAQLLESAAIIQACNPEVSWDAAIEAAASLIGNTQSPF